MLLKHIKDAQLFGKRVRVLVKKPFQIEMINIELIKRIPHE